MAISNTNTVTANLIYFQLPADGSKPYTNINADPSTGVREKNWVSEPHDVEIENVRGKEDTLTLDTTGFQYFRRPATHTTFTDDEEIEREYYPESIELVKELTGASRVVPFDHSTSFSENHFRLRRGNTNHMLQPSAVVVRVRLTTAPRSGSRFPRCMSTRLPLPPPRECIVIFPPRTSQSC